MFSYLSREDAATLCKLAEDTHAASFKKPLIAGVLGVAGSLGALRLAAHHAKRKRDKTASEEKKPSTWRAHMRSGAGGALAFGAGTAAGAGAGMLANKIYAHYNQGQKIPLKYLGIAAPVIGGLLASAYQRAHSSQEEDINRALANPDHHSSGGVSRG